MASVPFTISPIPGLTSDIIAVIYNTLAPAAEVARILKHAPHNNPYNFNFTNIPSGIYIVKIHETPDGVTLGTLRHDFWVDATLQKLLSYEVKTFQVGLGRGTPYFDPADQDTDYINTDLDGLTYTVFKPGYGPLDWAADITPRVGGGFTFTNGQVFAQDEIYTILISNLVTQPIQQSGVGFPDDIVTLNVDTVFSSAHYGKLLEIDSLNPLLTLSINLSAIPDGTMFAINTQKHNNILKNVVLNLGLGQAIIAKGISWQTAYVGRSEVVTLFKKGSVLRILNWDGDYKRIGEKVLADGLPPENSLPLDGGWYLKTDLPRAFNWYVNRLPAGEWEPGTDDITPAGDNIRKWIIGQNKFRAPDHRDVHYKVVDVGVLTNTYQADELGPGNVKTIAWTGATVGHNFLANDGVGFAATNGDGGVVTTDSSTGTNRNTARTGAWPIISPHGENRVRAVFSNAYVII
jgi:hypothetical protein